MRSSIEARIAELRRRYRVVPSERSSPEYLAELNKLVAELTSEAETKTPQARLADLMLPPAERLARLHEADIQQRFNRWMFTDATVHELSAALLLIARGEMDEEVWLHDHPLTTEATSSLPLLNPPAPDGAGSQSSPMATEKDSNESSPKTD
jgi:hypothetical protein